MKEHLFPTILTILAIAIFLFGENQVFRLVKKNTKSLSIRVARGFVSIVGITIILYFYLSQFDFTKSLGAAILQSGSLMLAIATFSFQQVLGNVISGVMLSTTRPFEIGDKIALVSTSGSIVVEGVVVDMNARHVKFQRADGRIDFVTNTTVDSCIIENSDILPEHGRIFTMECSYDSDVDIAMMLMEMEIKKHPMTIKKDTPAAQILCSNLTPNGYELKTTVWTKSISDSFKACSDLRVSISKVWKVNHIEIPYNTVTISNEWNALEKYP